MCVACINSAFSNIKMIAHFSTAGVISFWSIAPTKTAFKRILLICIIQSYLACMKSVAFIISAFSNTTFANFPVVGETSYLPVTQTSSPPFNGISLIFVILPLLLCMSVAITIFAFSNINDHNYCPLFSCGSNIICALHPPNTAFRYV